MATEHKTYELIVQPRDVIGKASKRLRKEHIVPGVIYGFGVDPTPVSIDQKELDRVYLRAGGNSLVDVKIGEGQPARTAPEAGVDADQQHPQTRRHEVRNGAAVRGAQVGGSHGRQQ